MSTKPVTQRHAFPVVSAGSGNGLTLHLFSQRLRLQQLADVLPGDALHDTSQDIIVEIGVDALCVGRLELGDILDLAVKTARNVGNEQNRSLKVMQPLRKIGINVKKLLLLSYAFEVVSYNRVEFQHAIGTR